MARFAQLNAHQVTSAVRQAGVPRLLVVGGAGSLHVAPDVQLVDTPTFPQAYQTEALAGRDFLNALHGEQQIDWTFLSPSALFEPGERTGNFRIGEEALLSDAAGKNWRWRTTRLRCSTRSKSRRIRASVTRSAIDAIRARAARRATPAQVRRAALRRSRRRRAGWRACRA